MTSPRPARPQRPVIRDELDAPRTLLADVGQYHFLPGEGEPLVLGLGPDPAAALAALPEPWRRRPARYLECPAFRRQMPPAWEAAIPPDWSSLALDPEAPFPASLLERLQRAPVLRHVPAARLFPSFWEPLLARLEILRRPPPPALGKPVALLPGGEGDLLQREPRHALEAAGFQVREDVPAEAWRQAQPPIRPAFCLSVNFRGLDPWGETFHRLDALGCPVAVWMVDNPWHLLSGVKARWWTQAHLFVTDHTFLPALRDHGARHVHHLPLAGWPEGFMPRGPVDASQAAHLASRGLFVGRTEFPNRNRFFAGQTLPPHLEQAARQLLESGEVRPDAAWWRERLGIHRCWPGPAIRQAGLGAAVMSLLWRTGCVRTALEEGMAMTVAGDEGWAETLPASPGLELRPPVDYHGPLAGLYRDAGWTLQASTLHLPAGLSQRHFDVWLAGGLLVSDWHEGLSLFPEDLWRPVVFRTMGELPAVARRLLASPATPALRAAWREEIASRHTYGRRVSSMLSACGIG